MKVILTPAALGDLDAIYDWIAQDNEAAAESHIRRLTARAMTLRDFPQRGRERPELGEGARSLVEGRYLILYRITREAVKIVRFVHGARDLDEVFVG